jgi:hypothetical protein
MDNASELADAIEQSHRFDMDAHRVVVDMPQPSALIGWLSR